MQNAATKNLLLPLVVIAVGLAAVFVLNPRIEAVKPELPDAYTDADLAMQGSMLRGFAFGMEGMLADWYYIRGLQYIGGKMLKRQGGIDLDNLSSLNPRLLYPFLETATSLDPHFVDAYSYGAIVLPAIDKEKAIALAEKGIRNNPNEWRLYQHLGFTYWKLGQYDLAAETYAKGAQIPGSSPFMALMAASMRTEGGSTSTARAIYRQMLAESTDEAVRITATRRLAKLDWLEERDAINGALAEFREKNGRCANTFGEVAQQIFQVQLPEGRKFRVDGGRRLVDPSNVPYLLDKEKCVVTLDRDRTELPPDE